MTDNSYPYDPDSEYGKPVNPKRARFANCPCFVPLDERSIGKSTESESEVLRVQAGTAAREQTIRVNLKECQTNERLPADASEILRKCYTPNS